MDLLTELKAIEDIRQLKSRYFRFLDTKDWAGMATIFCRDAIFDLRAGAVANPDDGGEIAKATADSVFTGVEAIVAFLSTIMVTVTSVHHGHGHEVTIDSADEAHGVIAMEDLNVNTGTGAMINHGYGHYHEQYRREGGVWRIWRSRLSRLKVDTGPGFSV